MDSSSDRPIISMIGNAHLDPAWMWQWGEGMEAFIATCRSALERMKETPEFVFTCSSAAHYRWIEEVEPALFAEIAQRVEEGRWEVVGGWWVQADCNLPSGEGFVRQGLLGQRYFAGRFGRRATVGYSPDAFGHNRGLPQLLAGAGMSDYIFCRPDPTELSLPSPLFLWRGYGGSGVVAYRVPFHYNMYESSVAKKVSDLVAAYTAGSPLTASGRPLRDSGREWALFYGVGNHGGGPTREHIREIIRIGNDPAEPGVAFGRLDGFFDRVWSDAEGQGALPVWNDDLQLNAPGCYSAHSQIKKLNRASEYELVVAERLSSLASLLLGAPYPGAELRRAWERVCFNHFHDIICGVAIREALDDAVAAYGEALGVARMATRYAMQRIARAIDTTGEGETLVLFNPHSWEIERHITFELWHDIDKGLWSQPVHLRITDDDGLEIPHQMRFPSGKIGRDRIAASFKGAIPAFGWRCYRVHYGQQPCSFDPAAMIDGRNGDRSLENDLLRVEFAHGSGAISSIYHKLQGVELLNGEGGVPVAIDDPTDTWGHGVEKFDRVIGRFKEAELKLVENGPTHATIRSLSRWRNSWIQQDFTLYRDSDRLHVAVKLFWAEEHVMLKLVVACSVPDPVALYEGAYCSVRKPCDGTERPGGAWTAVLSQTGGHGLGIVNNAKYGYSAAGATLAMTLLRSPGYAIHDPHSLDPDEDLDYLDQGMQRFEYVIVPLSGHSATGSLFREAALLNAPPLAHLESAHTAGPRPLPREYRGIEITPGSVQATVLKQSEDGTGWVVRLFETEGIETHAEVRLPLLGHSWQVSLRGYEVKTFMVIGNQIQEVDLTET